MLIPENEGVNPCCAFTGKGGGQAAGGGSDKP
jgi:hypothetical protein